MRKKELDAYNCLVLLLYTKFQIVAYWDNSMYKRVSSSLCSAWQGGWERVTITLDCLLWAHMTEGPPDM